jgi:hypothetical protein
MYENTQNVTIIMVKSSKIALNARGFYCPSFSSSSSNRLHKEWRYETHLTSQPEREEVSQPRFQYRNSAPVMRGKETFPFSQGSWLNNLSGLK